MGINIAGFRRFRLAQRPLYVPFGVPLHSICGDFQDLLALFSGMSLREWQKHFSPISCYCIWGCKPLSEDGPRFKNLRSMVDPQGLRCESGAHEESDNPSDGGMFGCVRKLGHIGASQRPRLHCSQHLLPDLFFRGISRAHTKLLQTTWRVSSASLNSSMRRK